MGGPTSGRRWHPDAKACTDECLQLDVRRWQREGYLTPGKTFSWGWMRDGVQTASIDVHSEVDRVTLAYRCRNKGADWEDAECSVQLDWMPCTYGGHRAWFRCPSKGCGRRAAILFFGGGFACRRCCRLAYRSQRVADYDRALRRAEKIRARLGWDLDLFNGEGERTKWMRQRTFERLCAEQAMFVNKSLSMIVSQLGVSNEPPD
ncbi:hypothetical protein TSA66_24580 [Noviherbaspirillum autotrophicum]|uniref:Uncharacterized protein n=1 Tax=Noviherbaspirillum autotrophicum TaxID=709839 RepID=A0A0C2BZ40_9BURK|nr:hypothetical protein TSA66_24580 [Noviherbaspirillum autotrophicum]